MSASGHFPGHEANDPRVDSARALWLEAGSANRPKAELERMLEQWGRTGMPFPRGYSVVDYFRDHARRQPDALALSDGVRHLSFCALDELSNRLANRLLRTGLKPADIVVVAMERSCGYVVAALGVLKAGGAYLPIDVHGPTDRLRLLLEDSGATFVVTAPEWLDRFGNWSGQRVGLDGDSRTLAGESAAPPHVPADPDRRAYVIYTSGSTGRPKGVEVEHHSLTNLVCFYHRWLGLAATDRTPLIANVGFDASVADLWPGLCAGGTILIPPKSLITDLDGLIQWLADEEITFASIPTALLELMLDRPWPARMALRCLGVGGDTLHVRPPPGLPFLLINQYGPTENTVDSTWAVVAPADEDSSRPSIGRPIGNVTVYVLNEQGARVFPGEPGELYLGGENIARGYLNRPELTRQRFVPDPFARHAAARMYRTGDWVRELPNGELEFIGRKDCQIQIRGRRVELGEIEQVLHQHPAVRQACCQPILDGEKATGVVAHIAVHQSQVKLSAILRAYLAERLPAYMVPAGFIVHESLPLTDRGKVDREALRADTPTTVTDFEVSLPEGSPQRAIARRWFQLLPQAAHADIHANFETLGGDSLRAIELLLSVEKIIGRRILLSDFMVNPTLPSLLRLVEIRPAGPPQPMITFQPDGHRPPVFCLYGVDGDIYQYLELAKALGSDQPVFGLRADVPDDPRDLPQSMEEIGAQAVHWIRECKPAGAPALVGYSWGGMLAFEIARQWVRAGGAAPFVVMIGAPAPRRHTTVTYRLWHFCRWLPAWLLVAAKDGRGHTMIQRARRCLSFLQTDPAELDLDIPDEGWAKLPIVKHRIAIENRYHPSLETPLTVHLFRESRSRGRTYAHPLDPSFTGYQPDSGWSHWAGRPVPVHWLETDHHDVLRLPVVNELAARIRTLMDQHYAAHHPPRR